MKQVPPAVAQRSPVGWMCLPPDFCGKSLLSRQADCARKIGLVSRRKRAAC